MKKIIILLMLITSFSSTPVQRKIEIIEFEIPEVSEWDILIEALIRVESDGNPYAVGSSNDVGILQITPIYVKEVNRILNQDIYILSHRTDIEKSLEMFEIYQAYYNPTKDIKKAIKLHNPGAGQWYTDLVMNEFNNIKG